MGRSMGRDKGTLCKIITSFHGKGDKGRDIRKDYLYVHQLPPWEEQGKNKGTLCKTPHTRTFIGRDQMKEHRDTRYKKPHPSLGRDQREGPKGEIKGHSANKKVFQKTVAPRLSRKKCNLILNTGSYLEW